MADIPMLLLAVHTDIALAYFASIGALFVRAIFRWGVHLVSLLAFRKKQVCERTPFFTRPRYSVVLPSLCSLEKTSESSENARFDKLMLLANRN
jgi:hypothetical protein